MKVLITGAHGFIGRHVVQLFSTRGWCVYGLGHGNWAEKDYRKWGLHSWHEHAVSLAAIREFGVDFDVIVHCAGSGSVSSCYEKPEEAFYKTVDSTIQVLEYIRMVNPGCRLVYTSSAAVYGNSFKLPLIEDNERVPVSVYGVYKKMVEDICSTYCSNYGVNATIIRLFSVYGTGLRKQLLWDACTRISQGSLAFQGTGRETRDWIHVSDAASLIYQSVESASTSCQAINGGTGQNVAVHSVLNMIKEQFNIRQDLIFNKNCRVGDPAHYQADISKALCIGWRPQKKLNDGIKEYVEWFKSEQMKECK